MTTLPAALLAVDEAVLDAAELLIDSFDDLPSPVGLARLDEALAAARTVAARVLEEGAGALPVRHVERGWAALEALAHYRFEWPARPVEDLLDAVFGPGTLPRLEAVLAGIDAHGTWEYLALRQSLRAGRLPVADPALRPRLEETARSLGAAFRAWLAAREGDLPGLDAAVVLGPGDLARSWYEPARHRVVLGPGEFYVFSGPGGPVVEPAPALAALAHELAGHAVQDALSRDLPPPLRPDHRGRLRYAALPAAEGFAFWRGELAVAFAEERGAEAGIGPRGLALLRAQNRFDALHHAVPACLAALAARARQRPGFDAVAHVAALAGHPGYGERVAALAGEPVNRLLYNAACHFGRLAVHETAARLAATGLAPAEVVRRAGRGAWALACLPDAIARA